MRAALAIIMSCLLFCSSLQSQFNVGFEPINFIPVVKNGDTLHAPWAGGLNNPQFSPMDFTGNSDQELFVFDRDGALRKGFKYNATTGKYDWVHTLAEDSLPFERHFPKLYDRGFCLIRDFDGDQKPDIFSTHNFENIKAYRNVGSSVPDYELEKLQVMYKSGSNILPFRMVRNTLPVLRDLDEDGDLDMMFFPVNYSDICSFSTFINQSVEEYGTADSLEFLFGDECWGHIRVSGGSHPIHNWREFSCDTTCDIFDGMRGKDITMTQNLHDLDGDGALDLLITYDHYDEIFGMYNSNTTMEGVIDQSQNDNQFPANDVQVKLNNQPYPYFIDMDHDGDEDMLIGSNQVNTVDPWEFDTSDASISDIYYENVGSNSAPTFELNKRGFISGEMIDVGLRSFPAFADLNGDSLPDMIIGNIGYNTFNAALGAARLQYYKNVGTLHAPIFELEDADFADVSSLGLRSAHPALADVDNDGDVDLVVGDHTGHLQFFKNIGHSLQHNFSQLTPNYHLIDAGGEAHPQFFDLNLDGRMDLVVGDEYGRIQYFENTGASSTPNYSSTPSIEDLGGINVFSELEGRAVPYFTRKLDSTNELYLFMGTGEGRINIYGPLLNFTDTFDLADSIIVEATQTSITGVDLLGDFRDELVIGQRAGGLYFLQKTNNQKVGISEVGEERREIQIQPNPTHETAQIRMSTLAGSEATLYVHDIQGKRLSAITINSKNGYFNEIIDLRPYPNGVFIVSIIEKNSVSWAKLIKN
jgi:hypothetical protein